MQKHYADHARNPGKNSIIMVRKHTTFVNDKYYGFPYSLVNILAKDLYFFPNTQILEPLFLPCFFVTEKFGIVIMNVIIFIYAFVKYKVLEEEIIFCQKFVKRGVKR